VLRDVPGERIALLLSLSLVLGTFPVYGGPTVLCAAAAFLLRLNFPTLQVLNQASSPLQIVLFAPLHRVGAHLIHGGTETGVGSVVATMLQAMAGWASVCVPAGFLTYAALLWVARQRSHISGAGA
jgi:hypothetical protein